MALTDNLLAFYKLSNLTDSSGYNRTLTNNGNVSFASGKLGNAAVFDGAAKEQLVIADTAIGNFGSSNFTLAGWFNPNSINGVVGVLAEHDGFNPLSWGVFLFNEGISFYGLNIPELGSVNWIGGGSVNINEWQHFVAKREGSTFKMILNNSVVGSQTIDGTTGEPNLPVCIGSDLNGSTNAAFDGKIDAVGIWNRALSDAEVAELYNNGTGFELDGVAQPALVKMQAPVKLFGKVKFGV